MKILIATGIYPPEVGGSATYVQALRNEWERAGHMVQVVTYGARSERRDGVQVIARGQGLVVRYWAYYRAVRAQLRDVDVVFAQDLISSGLPAALAVGKRCRRPLVVRVGGDFLWEQAYNRGLTDVPLREYYTQPKSLIERVYLRVYRFVLQRCQRVVFSTSWQRRIFEQHVGWNADRYAVIDNAFPRVPELLVERGSEVLFVGRLIPLKNIERLAAAVQAVPDVSLTVIGDGPNRAALEHAGVRMQPARAHADVLRAIAKSFVVVVPSISEVSPNVVLECIKLKKPMIVTRECGYYERYRDILTFIDPTSVEDIASAIAHLRDDREYTRYQERLAHIDTSRSFAEVAQEWERLFTTIRV